MPDHARRWQLELPAKLPLERRVPGGVEAAQVFEILRERQPFRQLLAFRYVADALEVGGRKLARGCAEHADLATVRLQDVHQQADGGGLARAIRADQCKHRALGYPQFQVLDRLEAAELLRQAPRLNDHSPPP